MPVYTFEGVIQSALDKLQPGGIVLTNSYHRSSDITAIPNAIQVTLFHRTGVRRIMCGVFTLGKDTAVCS
jgi:hypothetical protein